MVVGAIDLFALQLSKEVATGCYDEATEFLVRVDPTAIWTLDISVIVSPRCLTFQAGPWLGTNSLVGLIIVE